MGASCPEHEAAVRAAISFPPYLYKTLEEVAKRNKVSLAWVVRDVTEKYVAAGQEGGLLPHDSAQRSARRADR
jgi:hypothetical protein